MNMSLRGAGSLSWAYLLETLRSKTALFWSIAFPLFFLVGFAYIFGRGEARQISYLLPGILTITIISASFFGVAMNMVGQREKGVFRRYRVTPVSSLSVVIAFAATALFSLILSMILQLVAARLLFDVAPKGSLIGVFVCVAAAAFAFIPMGLIVGSISRDTKTAPAITNLLFFPMMFLSGAALPFFLLPQWLQKIGSFIPATYVVEMFQGTIFRGDDIGQLLFPLIILVITGIVGFVVNALTFRWESDEPINTSGLITAAGVVLGVYLLAFLFGPMLGMATKPKPAQAAKSTTDDKLLVIDGATIIDGLGNVIDDGRILVRGDEIEASGSKSDIAVPEGAEVLDRKGMYITPGLFDSHVHLGGSAGGAATIEEHMQPRMERDLEIYLALGVTNVISLTDEPDLLNDIRDRIAAGQLSGPRIFMAGASITAPGGHPAARFSSVPGLAERATRQVTNAEEAREAVKNLVSEHRVDIIKLVLEAGSYSGGLPILDEAAFRAAVATARELGIKTTVHVDADPHVRLAIDAGADGLEHAPADLSDETLALMAEKGITITPSLAVVEGMATAFSADGVTDPWMKEWTQPMILESLSSPQSWIATIPYKEQTGKLMGGRLDASADMIARAAKANVLIIAGSDAGNAATFHGPGLIREMELLVEKAGMAPSEVIISATSRAADRLGKADLGRIAPGAKADLVILKDNPLENIRAFRGIHEVYLMGKPVAREIPSLLATN